MLQRGKKLERYGVMLEAISVYEDYLKLVPTDSDTRKTQVELLLKLNRIRQALPHIDRLKQEKPNDPRVKEFVTIANEYRNQVTQQQIEDYRDRLKRSNNDPPTLLEYARYLTSIGMTESAIAAYKQYLGQKPNDDQVRFELAQNYAWNKRYDDCNQELDNLLTKNPRNVDGYMLLGDINYWQDKNEIALTAYNRVLQISPNNREAIKKIDQITNQPEFKEKRLLQELEKEPNGKALNELAELYLSLGRDYEAEPLVQRRLQIVPDDNVALGLDARIQQIRNERLQKQIEDFKNRLTINPSDTTALLGLARYYASVPDFPNALDAYDKYVALYPADYVIQMERATVLAWAGDNEEAALEFRAISLTLPDNRQAKLGLAEALLASNTNLEEAQTIFQRDMEAYPDELHPRIGYADALRHQGEYEKARKLYNQILEEYPDNTRAKQGLIWLDQDLGPLIRKLENYLKNQPDDVDARWQLAGLCYDAKRFYDAEQHLLILQKNDPGNQRIPTMLKDIDEKKKSYWSLELQRTKKWLSEHPDDVDARLRYADMLTSEGHFIDAAAQYRLVLEKRPNDPEVSLKLAQVLNAENQFDQAIEILLRLVGNNPGNFAYRVELAKTYSWKGDYNHAFDEYQRALQLNPSSMECRIAIANIYRWSGDPYKALDEYNRVLAIDIENEEAQKAIREINRIFLRGIRAVGFLSEDNEDFVMQESFIGVIVNFSLRMQLETGMGRCYFEQSDTTKRYLYSELGWFLYGQIDYRFDSLTRGILNVRHYTFANRNSYSLRFDLEHDFQDVPELKGAYGRIFYSTRDAVFDLASTKDLLTWTNKLTSDKFGIFGRYTRYPKWLLEGEFDYLTISDGNGRLDLWLEVLYQLQRYMHLGLRYDHIQAEVEAEEYWAPHSYTSIMGVAQLKNSFTRWNYKLHGGLGRILGTGYTTRNFSAALEYRLRKSTQLGLSYFSLVTSRYDGRYKYSGITGSVTWSK